MKAKNILLLAALAFSFMACEKKEPFDTQSANDAPIILVPYETADGKVYGTVYNPSPYVDSVIVTPSAYTTVNWYLDKALVHTGNKINMCFPTGTYDLLIEAVTTAGKRTTRSGVLTVKPAATDPYSGAPAAGRHFVPNTVSTISGTNLTQVVKLVLSRDLYAKDTVCTIDVTTTDDASISFTLPALADGKYYLRLQDAEGNLFGADAIEVHNASVALSGYEAFVPNKEWTITGAKLENVASVTIDETVITELTATATSVTFVAPDAEVGEHTHDGLAHGAGTAHIVFDILGSLVVFEVGLEHHLVYEAGGVGNTCLISCRIRTVEGKVEMEIGELLLQLMEVVKIEHLVEGTSAIEIMHLAVSGVEGLGHVHYLCTERSHTCATAYPYHLLL